MTGSATVPLRQQVTELIARYNWGIDTRDADAIAATFAPDGVFDGLEERYTGHDELRGFVAAMADRPRAQGLQHWVTNTVILDDLDSTVRARSYMVGVKQGSPPEIVLAGHYDDTLRRTADGGLVFAERIFRLWGEGVELAAKIETSQ